MQPIPTTTAPATEATPRRSFRVRVRAAARLAAYGTVVALLLGGAAARAEYDRIADGQLRMARDLGDVKDLLGETNTVVVNGSPMQVSVSVTHESVGHALDRFEAVCEGHPQFE